MTSCAAPAAVNAPAASSSVPKNMRRRRKQPVEAEATAVAEGATPLMYAAQQARTRDVKDILQNKPGSVRERDRTLKTALHYCAEAPAAAAAQVAELLLAADPDLLDAKDEDGYTPLHLAVIAGSRALIKLLLAKGANANSLDNEKHSVVHWATVCGEVEALELVLEAGALASTPDIHGGYPVHYAAQMCGPHSEMGPTAARHGLAVLRKLLHSGVGVNVTDRDGRQPILWAASAGSADAILALVNAGANVEAEDKDGLTALHCAASRGHTDCLETLISLCGAEADVLDGNGCTALFYAVTLGHADATRLLLGLGAKPDRQDRRGRTPAHCGASKGQLETLRILAAHGANIWMKNVRGDLPLHEAVASGRKELVRWLLNQRPESINAANNDGRCPLHVAALHDSVEMCKILLDSEALVNPVMRTSKGQMMTPLDAALHRGNRGCAKYLQVHGGVPAGRLTGRTAKLKGAAHSRGAISETHSEAFTSPDPFLHLHGGGASVASASPAPTNNIDHVIHLGGQIGERRTESRSLQVRLNDDVAIRHVERIDPPIPAVVCHHHHHYRESILTSADEEKEDIRLRRTRRTRRRADLYSSEDERLETPPRPKAAKNRHRRRRVYEPKSDEDLASTWHTYHYQEKKTIDGKKSKKNNDSESIEDDEDEEDEEEEEEDEEAEAEEEEEEDGNNLVAKSEISEDEEEEIIMNGKSSDDGRGEKNIIIKKGKGKKENKKINILTNKKQKLPKGIEENIPEEEQKITIKKDLKKKKRSKSEEKTQKSSKDDEKEEGKEKKMKENSKKKRSKSEENNKRSKSKDNAQKGKLKKEEEIKSKISSQEIDTVEDSKMEIDLKKESNSGLDIELKKEENKGEIDANENLDKEVNITETGNEQEKGEIVGEIEEKEKKDLETIDESKQMLFSEYRASGSLSFDEDGGTETLVTAQVHREEETEEKSEESTSAVVVIVEEAEDDDGEKGEEEENIDGESVNVTEGDSSVKISEMDDEEVAKGEEEVVGKEEGEESKETEESETKEDDESKSESKIEKLDEDESKTEDLETKEEEEKIEEDKEDSMLDEVLSKGGVDIFGEEINDFKNWEEVEELENSVDEKEKKSKEEITSDLEEEQGEQFRADSEASITQNEGSSQFQDSGFEPSPRRRVESESAKNTPKMGRKKFTRPCRHSEGEEEINEGEENRPEINTVSVTQAVQNSMRKYHLERRIFHELLELKRLQIRAGRANEQVLVKRLVDDYRRAGLVVGLKPFDGTYTFRSFEKYLYEQLRVLQSTEKQIVPRLKSSDDLEKLTKALRRARYNGHITEDLPPDNPIFCTFGTHRCQHATHAYTGIPCAAYRRRSPALSTGATTSTTGAGPRPGGAGPRKRDRVSSTNSKSTEHLPPLRGSTTTRDPRAEQRNRQTAHLAAHRSPRQE